MPDAMFAQADDDDVYDILHPTWVATQARMRRLHAYGTGREQLIRYIEGSAVAPSGCWAAILH